MYCASFLSPKRIASSVAVSHAWSAVTISTLFGILNINFTRPVTIFEGPIDAKFINNSLALCTVGRNVEQFTDIPTIRYMFDNDYEGKAKMIQKLKKGQTVFMWDKYLKDFGIPKKKVKDLNDLVKYEFKNRTGCLNELDKYFTNNHLDLIFL